jgi:hypothetical protein
LRLHQVNPKFFLKFHDKGISVPIINTQSFRFAFCLDKASHGWKAETCGPVSWALYPFDDYPVPPRQLEKAIRKRCKEFAKGLKNVNNNEAASVTLAIQTAADYVQLAKNFEAEYFVELWTKLHSQAIAGQEMLK